MQARSNPILPLLQRVFRHSFYESLIAWRIIRARKKKSLSVITIISITGIILGVMALTIVLGITGGFQEAFRERILGMYPHMVILKRAGDFDDYRRAADLVSQVPGVAGVSPATSNEMMATSNGRRSGVIVKGIDLPTVDRVSNLTSLLKLGSLALLDEVPRLSLSDGRLEVSNLVEGGAHLAVVVDGRAFSVPDVSSPPDLGMARLRLVVAAPDAGSLALRVEPSELQALDSEGDSGLVRQAASLGQATPYVDADPGKRAFEVLSESGAVIAKASIPLEIDGSYTIFVLPAEGPAIDLRLEKDPPPKVPEGQSLVRLFNATASPLALQIEGEPEPAIPELPSFGLSGYAQAAGRLPGIVLGVKLAERLRAEPGSTVTLVSPLRGIDNKMLGPFGMAPTSARYTVSGVFDSGFHEYDVRLSLVDFGAAQRFLNRGDVAQWLDVRFDDVLKVKGYSREVKSALDPYSLPDFLDATAEMERRLDRIASGDVRGYPMRPPEDVAGYLRNVTGAMHLMASQGLDFGVSEQYKLIDWEEMNHNLFSALKLQKVVLSIFFLIIIVVAAFNVVGSQIMIVHEKSSSIAILKSMGATSGQVRKIFLLQGLMVSGVGTLVGLLLGLGVSMFIDVFGYPLDPEVYLIGRLPVVINVLESALVALGGLVFTFLAIQYSAGRASKKTPVEGLRSID